MQRLLFVLVMFTLSYGCKTGEQTRGEQPADTLYKEAHRPQFHFSPPENWMNDPNGMVFHNGEYHLFYQYYPDGTTWGPMHWGHAVTTDLTHWKHLPVALYPDSLGWIFSGSAIVDTNNTSGFGTAANPPLVAIYTYHSSPKEKAGRTDYQYQGIAYSTDNGRNWTKYEGNPVLPNQGVPDFRDPKVFWHEPTSGWVMILAVKDHIELWGSADLKNWRKRSEFGANYGAHGGVWECPDLFTLPVEGSAGQKWVMLVSINPGGPNGGSATQYFTGGFDGTSFTPDVDQSTTLWLDYGPDNYAGVTWSNVPGERKIFLGWMSNWAYAEKVPTSPWRSANTIARDLVLAKTPAGYRVRSIVSPELNAISSTVSITPAVTVEGTFALNQGNTNDLSMSVISAQTDVKNFSVEFSNSKGQTLVIGFDVASNKYYINRAKAGNVDFSPDFRREVFAPRISESNTIDFTIVADVSSVEVFFDAGLSVMTALFFPDEPLGKVVLKSPQSLSVHNLEVKTLQSVW
jgi:fructan beta-fructosidase